MNEQKARGIIGREYGSSLYELIACLFVEDRKFRVDENAEGYACFCCHKSIGDEKKGRLIIETTSNGNSKRGICDECYSNGLDALTC